MAVSEKRKGRRREERARRPKRQRERTVELDDDEDDDFDPQVSSETVEQITARLGSARAAAQQLHADRIRATRRERKWRDRAVELEEEVEDLRDRLGLGDDDLPEKAVVMTEADKKELEDFRALGKFEDVKKKVEEHGTLSQAAEESKGKGLTTESAKLAGDWNSGVLGGVLTQFNLELEIREVDKEGGGKDRVPFVREKGKDKAEWSRLTEYVSRTEGVKDYLPALTAKGNGGESSSGSSTTTRTGGIAYPRTTGDSGSRSAPDLVATRLGARDFRPSAAKKAGTTTQQ